jgi:TPR repeat protein
MGTETLGPSAPSAFFALFLAACGAPAPQTPGPEDDPGTKEAAPEPSLQQRCDGDEAEACIRLADALHLERRTSADYVARDLDTTDRKALDLYSKACVGRIGRACNMAGAMLQHGAGVEIDVKRAVDFYESGCELENAVSCYNLGFVLLIGEGIEPDPGAALAPFDRACQTGIAHACTALAMIFERGITGEASSERAVTYWKQALPGLRAECASDAEACVTYWSAMLSAGVETEEAKAALRTSCDSGRAEACLALADFVDDGLPLLEKACELQDQCFSLARVRQAATDSRKRSALYERACRAREWEACAFAGPRAETMEGLHFVRVKCKNLRDPKSCDVLAAYEKRVAGFGPEQ